MSTKQQLIDRLHHHVNGWETGCNMVAAIMGEETETTSAYRRAAQDIRNILEAHRAD